VPVEALRALCTLLKAGFVHQFRPIEAMGMCVAILIAPLERLGHLGHGKQHQDALQRGLADENGDDCDGSGDAGSSANNNQGGGSAQRHPFLSRFHLETTSCVRLFPLSGTMPAPASFATIAGAGTGLAQLLLHEVHAGARRGPGGPAVQRPRGSGGGLFRSWCIGSIDGGCGGWTGRARHQRRGEQRGQHFQHGFDRGQQPAATRDGPARDPGHQQRHGVAAGG
jgi:hypothetical protein